MLLHTLPCGDTLYRYNKCTVLNLAGKRRILSTSIYNGGIHENFNYVYNHCVFAGAGVPSKLTMDNYMDYMRQLTIDLGFDPEKGTGMGTAAFMENTAIAEESYEMLTVTAIVTGGIEVNGGRVGDPASYFKPLKKGDTIPTGTINIMLHIDGDLAPGVLARALVTCTEAKTAALQELMANSRYSNGLATGSGTDQTVIICNSDSPYAYDSAGKHNKVGELIGKAVKRAVKDALHRQTRLSPYKQYNAFRRLDRFGINEETIYNLYKENGGTMAKCEAIKTLELWAAEPSSLRTMITAIHGMDEWLWHLISDEDLWYIFAEQCHFLSVDEIPDHKPFPKDIRSKEFKLQRKTNWTIDGDPKESDEEKQEKLKVYLAQLSCWILKKALQK